MKADGFKKLETIPNARLHRFIADAVELCNPDSVFVCSDDPKDIDYVRRRAVETGDEKPLKMEGHTVHFDGYYDQARDKANTKFLVLPGVDLGTNVNSLDRSKGLAEIRGILKNIMVGKEMIIRFFTLGPRNSIFSISAVQLTDSAYVAHSEDLLYRPGYEEFKRLDESEDFFAVIHSAGETENNISVNVDQRRIYIDVEDEVVYSVNTQYAGNTVGFKKLSLRLTIRKADRESWLAEHMLVMGVRGPNGRTTYFTGAFPSFCGKTSTAMVPGETIVGDDIAYLRRIRGRVHAVNVECGIFGIIQDVNPDGDPIIWELLTSQEEIVFSNVLVADGVPYWAGDGRNHPEQGINYAGKWHLGMKDKEGNEIPASHKNARYCLRLNNFPNLDELAEDPKGVPIGGVIYGGRDGDTWVPVQESFSWGHGVVTMGASLESETTAATIGQEGIRSFQPMSNLDFLSIPLGRYVQNHIMFGIGLQHPPVVFAVNYFLKNKEGQYLNGIKDKYVWLKWMELRVNNDVPAVLTPTGYIPRYEDLEKLFRAVLGKGYSKEEYVEQFTLRIPEHLKKINRIEKMYRAEILDAPHIFFDVLNEQRQRLLEAREQYGECVSPYKFLEP
jgi:phosphoenolpyruvate carboxykinase (GTP)